MNAKEQLNQIKKEQKVNAKKISKAVELLESLKKQMTNVKELLDLKRRMKKKGYDAQISHRSVGVIKNKY